MTHRKLIISMLLLAALSAVALQPVAAAPSADDVVAKHDTDNDKRLDAQEVAGVVGPKAFQAADTDHDGTLSAAAAAPPAAVAPIKIAVFEFELEDNSPSADLLKQRTTREDSLHKVTAAAREQLAGSGRYTIVGVDAADDKPVKDGTLRNCEGCEAAIARKLGAQQSMIGVVQRATQTDYYIAVVIRDANTGKVLDSQDANFAGSEEGWPTGVRMLIKHQVLPP
jgi:hypothetical protein